MPATSVDDRRAVVVVPCYNEAGRLDGDPLRVLAESVDVWMVDDGSTDSTRTVLGRVAEGCGARMRALSNPANLGKAETVRLHLREACTLGAPFVGFLDADLATSVDEWLEMLRLLQATGVEGVTGARVALSGRDIQRSGARHYLGRVFSTVASLAMSATYYDTQCGAKVFRNGPALRTALSEPFLSRWAFDVELLGRLLAGGPDTAPVAAEHLVEHPLRRWHDIAGSKLSSREAWRSGAELLRIWRDLASRRRRRASAPR